MDEAHVRAHLLKKGLATNVFDIQEISEGLLNALFLAHTDRGSMVVKRYGDFIKSDPRVKLPGDRYPVEKNAYLLLSQLFDESPTPRLLDFDDDTKTLVIEALNPTDRLDRSLLNLEPQAFTRIGQILGMIVKGTYKRSELREVFGNTAFQELKYKLKYYDNITNPKHHPVRDALMMRTRSNKVALMLGDVRLTNLFVRSDQVRLIDFEGAYFCDATIDIAYLFTEIFIHFCDSPSVRLENDLRALWSGFTHACMLEDHAAFEETVVKHIGFHLIDQIIGVIKQEYTFVQHPQSILQVADTIITDDNIRTLDHVLSLVPVKSHSL